MQITRTFSKWTALVAAASIGLTACSDDPTSSGIALTPKATVALQVSSANAAVGSRIGVAVKFNAPVSVAGIQGRLEFDASRLKYVGQSMSDAPAIVGAQRANVGQLEFTSFDLSGLRGRVALFVFEVKQGGYTQSIAYAHRKASMGTSAGILPVSVSVQANVVDATVPVPADARQFRIEDWKSTLVAAGKDRSVTLRPGDLQHTNLMFGDVNYDDVIGLDDYLAIAFAAVGLDEIIVGTDGPTRDVDLVMAGNVFPSNYTPPAAPACGTSGDGSRVLDLDDYLGIAFYAVSLPTEPCIGQVIPGRGPVVTDRQILSGSALSVTGTLHMTKDKVWQLDGLLYVEDGGVLQIDAGTRVEGNSALNPTGVMVRRGGKIMANGTQYEPIVFTCTGTDASKVSGCWSGVWISGRGTVNLGDGVLPPSPDGGCPQRASEAGFGMDFGGCNPADNSGELSYAIIEFGGFIVSLNKELNCLTLAGVGSATNVHHIQCHGGLDDGVEIFGGSASVHHMVLTANNDDGFDLSFGHNGQHQFVIIQDDAGDGANDTKGLEIDGTEPAPGSSSTPRTQAKMFNFTIIGNLTARTQTAAMQFRRGAGVSLYNSVVAGWEKALDLDDPLTCDGFDTGPGEIKGLTLIEVTTLDNTDGSDPVCGGFTNEATYLAATNRFQNITGALGTQIGTYFVDAYNTRLPDWRMKTDIGGNPLLGNTVPLAEVTGGAAAWIQATNYRGAVPAGVAGNIPWYAGWTRPWRNPTTP